MAAGPPTPADDELDAPEQGSRSGAMVMCAVAALVLVMSLVGGQDTTPGSRAPQAASAGASASSEGGSAQPADTSAPSAGRPPTKRLPRSKPVRLLIPKISVDAPFTDLAIGPSGQLEPPPAADTNLVGWYAKGPSPGEIGTSVIAGHVDTATSPAVFVGLGELEEGDVFHVRRADGRKASFEVDDVETFEKDDFPDERVYGDSSRPEVRLITCAGEYDRKVRDYTENLVVFAHLV
ncbi:class F sortase [Streptomyces sp. NPDC001595]|uniref:class F sortase n=1 Tax=Streptomyces sp. NPDC001532 TaxID=3154520 RepID=UPI00332B7924